MTLTIKLRESDNPDDKGSVGFEWVNSPVHDHMPDEVWHKWFTLSRKVTNGIHALIGNLGPLPPNGWIVEYEIGDVK